MNCDAAREAQDKHIYHKQTESKATSRQKNQNDMQMDEPAGAQAKTDTFKLKSSTFGCKIAPDSNLRSILHPKVEDLASFEPIRG